MGRDQDHGHGLRRRAHHHRAAGEARHARQLRHEAAGHRGRAPLRHARGQLGANTASLLRHENKRRRRRRRERESAFLVAKVVHPPHATRSSIVYLLILRLMRYLLPSSELAKDGGRKTRGSSWATSELDIRSDRSAPHTVLRYTRAYGTKGLRRPPTV